MSTVKISNLTAAEIGDITNDSDVIVINDASTTKKITVDNFLAAAGRTVSGSLIPVTDGADVTSSFNLGSAEAAWGEIFVATSSINFVASDGTITKFTKADVANLKEGKSLRTGSKQIVHESDESTFVQMKSSAPGRVIHKVSDISLFDMATGSFQIGDPTVPLTLRSNTFSITGSTDISGSTTVSGSFTVTDLLTVLADYGQTGSFGVSGSSTFQGDVNMDGAVNVNDLLTVLAGFGASGSNSITGSLVIDGGGIGERSLVITGSTDVSGSTTISGSFDQSGSFNSEGDSSFSGSFNQSGSFNSEGSSSFNGNTTITGSFEQSGSSTFTGGGFNVNNLLDLLANFSSSGVEGGVTEGDINLDGQVNVNDLLLGLAGYGNPNTIANNILIPPNINHQYIGPTITILSPVSMSISTGSFVSITS